MESATQRCGGVKRRLEHRKRTIRHRDDALRIGLHLGATCDACVLLAKTRTHEGCDERSEEGEGEEGSALHCGRDGLRMIANEGACRAIERALAVHLAVRRDGPAHDDFGLRRLDMQRATETEPRTTHPMAHLLWR